MDGDDNSNKTPKRRGKKTQKRRESTDQDEPMDDIEIEQQTPPIRSPTDSEESSKGSGSKKKSKWHRFSLSPSPGKFPFGKKSSKNTSVLKSTPVHFGSTWSDGSSLCSPSSETDYDSPSPNARASADQKKENLLNKFCRKNYMIRPPCVSTVKMRLHVDSDSSIDGDKYDQEMIRIRGLNDPETESSQTSDSEFSQESDPTTQPGSEQHMDPTQPGSEQHMDPTQQASIFQETGYSQAEFQGTGARPKNPQRMEVEEPPPTRTLGVQTIVSGRRGTSRRRRRDTESNLVFDLIENRIDAQQSILPDYRLDSTDEDEISGKRAKHRGSSSPSNPPTPGSPVHMTEASEVGGQSHADRSSTSTYMDLPTHSFLGPLSTQSAPSVCNYEGASTSAENEAPSTTGHERPSTPIMYENPDTPTIGSSSSGRGSLSVLQSPPPLSNKESPLTIFIEKLSERFEDSEISEERGTYLSILNMLYALVNRENLRNFKVMCYKITSLLIDEINLTSLFLNVIAAEFALNRDPRDTKQKLQEAIKAKNVKRNAKMR